LTGIPEVTLYRWVKNGQVRVRVERGFMLLDKYEVEKERDEKEKRKGLARLIAKRKRIQAETARRWIKRMENQGLNQKELLKRGKEICVRG
jgi:predicted site-specific integrase-resolvase